ncbi:MAG: tetratricopeptide repeat protein [Parabacteroides sp.]
MERLPQKMLCSLSLTLLCSGAMLFGQSLDQAKKLYNEGQYAEAKPAFERLIKQAPSNPSYNLWYGVCCFETGDLTTAAKHLKVAVKRRTQEAYRYLGEVYFLTYQFDEAAEMFEEYINLLSKKKQDTAPFETRLETANEGDRLLDKVEAVEIIDSLVVDKSEFLSAYTLSEEAGKLSYYDDFFQTGQNVASTVYTNQKGDKIYYAHPTAENQTCLFTQSKLMDHWGDEKQLPMNVNSTANDNYPFVLSDGVTIYYASEGNGSLGGYDLFVTRYNTSSDSYLAPEQLGMPFNSPFNDYMIVIDEAKQLGWFVSDRHQPDGKVCVYLFIPDANHARVESDDIELKRRLAAVNAIQESWRAGADYSAQIQLAHQAIPFGKPEVRKDFTFAINDQLTYYILDDIQNPEAKKLYQKVIALRKQIQQQTDRLETLRTNYHKGNSGKKEQLTPTILQAEQQLDELLPQPDEWEKKARNAEVQFLSKKK